MKLGFESHTCALILPGGSVGEESACNAGDLLQHRRPNLNPWVRKIPWRRKWQPTPVFLLGEFHGQRSLAGYSPWGRKELDTTEHTHPCSQGLRDPAGVKTGQFSSPLSPGLNFPGGFHSSELQWPRLPSEYLQWLCFCSKQDLLVELIN